MLKKIPLREESKLSFDFEDVQAKKELTDLTLQIIDERSKPEENLIYPVVGMNVRVLDLIKL